MATNTKPPERKRRGFFGSLSSGINVSRALDPANFLQ